MRKQLNSYVVRSVICESGERLPMLCARDTGLPLFEPTLYALTELRARNRSSSTIQQALRSVMVLYLVLNGLDVDLDLRLAEGRLLELGEVEEIAQKCRLSLDVIIATAVIDTETPPPKGNVVALEKARMRSLESAGNADVDPISAAVRIRYIRDYLNWRSTDRLLKLGPQHTLFSGLQMASSIVSSAFDARIPSSSGRNTLGQREGMSAEALARLIDVIEPTSQENPWKGDHARERNALMVKWLISLGVRRGELLGVKTSDINFHSNEVLIARRADDPSDSRKSQPNSKTKDRLLGLDEDLTELTRRYITGRRRAIRGSRKNEFLFVANGTGAQLTLAALNKVFVALRQRCPDLPETLTPHVLRHTWNDTFSEIMDKKGIPEQAEKKMRSRLMGWSETSNTAATYTRRHVQRKARAVSLELQQKMKNQFKNDT